MADMKQTFSRHINCDFKNLTKNVLDQKESNLCVPISAAVLLRWAIKNDLNCETVKLDTCFTIEVILTILTMVVYPRSLAGFNLNPIKDEQEFQLNDIDMLFRRLKHETYLNKSGWDIINYGILNADFDFQRGF